MFHAETKGFILRVVAGATGLSLALFLLKSHGKPDSFLGLPEALSTAKETSAVQENQRAVMVLQGRQLQILEKLGSLLKSVEELKEEVKYLKDAIPKLEEQIRDELNEKNNVQKISPQHKVLKRKKETAKGAVEYPSSEESEGGYLTAHTDTEVETEDESTWAHPNAVTTKVIQETDELLSLLHQADTKRSGSVSDKQEGFHLLCDMEEKYGNKAEFLWRLARAYGDMFDLTNNAEEKKNYAGNGKSVAGKAIQLDNMNARSHQWYAIMCGYVSEFDSVQNKIKNGYLFKEHLDKAIELDPRDPLQYYLLGRWCYAVSQLSWIERKVAATIFGNPPTSTVQDALQNFLKAEEMHPGYSKYNYVFLAKCYKDLGQKINALKCCDAASAIVSVTKEDRDAQKDLEVLLASLRP